MKFIISSLDSEKQNKLCALRTMRESIQILWVQNFHFILKHQVYTRLYCSLRKREKAIEFQIKSEHNNFTRLVYQITFISFKFLKILFCCCIKHPNVKNIQQLRKGKGRQGKQSMKNSPQNVRTIFTKPRCAESKKGATASG